MNVEHRMNISCQSIEELCRESIRLIDEAVDLPPKKLGKEADKAENKVVMLRDCLIDRLRSDDEFRWREPLDQVNMALSYIAGIEYPATGIHRNYLKSAKEVLEKVRDRGKHGA